ncbi:TetR/AcrR family transcriptional regulator [Mesorhizobium sp. IMUNJ 23232]|uniref:TetR/AcrR family transcriptional regulator n=1 Tax=Mesorhizobium sp. IMUNJ 23232 TaxID=3376064 RepID=UPI0037B86710
MRVSREKAEENRAAIVEAGARLFREQGFDRVSVADVCGEAGLTHGGFYGHFASKDALEAECVDAAFADKIAELTDPASVAAMVGRYLSATHRDNPGRGCAVAALGAAVPQRDELVRQHFAADIGKYLDALTAALVEEAGAGRDRAILLLSALVGGLTLARAGKASPELSEEILASLCGSLGALPPAGTAST